MAKPTDALIENPDAAVISDIAVPDAASLGWPPADHVFIHVEGQQAVGAITSPGAEGVEDSSVIEFTVADLPANNLLADIDSQDLGVIDLNDLLGQPDTVPEGHMLLVSDEPDVELNVAETPLQAESSPSDVHHLPINMAFPQLTIVIDDESGPDTVAI